MLKCEICQIELVMNEAHVDHRGWLCDQCYSLNQPWMQPDDGQNGGAVGC